MNVNSKLSSYWIINQKYFLILVFSSNFACQTQIKNQSKMNTQPTQEVNDSLELATFGGGCFWCTEAMFDQLEGVLSVESGYAGGMLQNPTYEQICTGNTGHAEVIRIAFDPKKIDYEFLLEVFFNTHDPTTLNRQGNDIGTQYRSAVFYHSDDQKQAALKIIKELTDQNVYKKPIVTEVTSISNYFKAEDYHQEYLENNPNNPYCEMVVSPKVEKFKKKYAEKLKK